MDSILEVRSLNVYYGDVKIVKNINLAYEKNSIYAIIGPSGCGKSTYLRSLNRIHETAPKGRVEGEVLFNGVNIYDSSINVVQIRQQIGMVFQRPNPFPGLSLYENVIIGPKLNGNYTKSELKDLAESCLKKAALWEEVKDKLNRSGSSLSGGQQQRLCLARALALNPAILLMDEPTSALDPIATSKIEDLMDELKKEYTIILVTHNMGQASRVSDYTTFMMSGEVVENSKTENLFTNPKEKRTEDYIMRRFA